MKKLIDKKNFFNKLLEIQSLSVRTLLRQFDFKNWKGNNDIIINSIGSMRVASENTLFFVSYLEDLDLRLFNNSCFLLSEYEFSNLSDSEVRGNCFICSSDPRGDFLKIVRFLRGDTDYAYVTSVAASGMKYIDPSADVSQTARVGNSVVGRGCVIMDNAVIGDGVWLGAGSTILPGACIGFAGFGFLKSTDDNFPHCAGVYVGENCVVGSNTSIQGGALNPTKIGDFTKIDNLCQIAHGVSIGRESIIIAGSHIGGSSCIGRNVWIGQNCVISNGISIGDCCHVASGSVVFKSLDSECRVYGNPARPFPNGRIC